MSQALSTASSAENVRWDLSDLYTSIDDPALERDLQSLLLDLKAFHDRFAGQLHTQLGAALTAQADLSCLADQLMVYLFLRKSTDATNQQIQQRLGQVQEAFSEASANYLTFFEHEVAGLSDEVYAGLLASDAVVATHQPMLDQIRVNRRYLLDQPVERALQLRSPFGSSEWADLIDEREAELRFELDGA